VEQKNIEKFYKETFDKHVRMVSNCLKYNKHLSEDIVQTSFMKAFEKLDTYDKKKGSLQTWFNTILFNTLRDYQRKNKATVPISVEMIDTLEYVYKYYHILSGELLEVPNPMHRRIIESVYFNGYTTKQVASAEKITVTNVTSICSRFRKQIKDKYGMEL
jgi:RNA polymerase sigma factor (sigma-70 family)